MVRERGTAPMAPVLGATSERVEVIASLLELTGCAALPPPLPVAGLERVGDIILVPSTTVVCCVGLVWTAWAAEPSMPPCESWRPAQQRPPHDNCY